MKKKLIVLLVCLNAALLVALMVGSAVPTQGQVVGGGADYILLTAHIGSDWDGVYVIDLAKRRMLMLYFDKTKKRLLPYRGVDLTTDFRAGVKARP